MNFSGGSWLLAGLLLIGGDGPPSDPMLHAASSFLAALDDDERAQALQRFDDDERTRWSYLPGRRDGLHLGALSETQRDAAFRLLRTALSTQGYTKALGVIELEGVLRELEGDFRNPDLYWFTFYGTPSSSSPWGWRLEGHHLSLNFTSVASELVAATPAFFGAHPATVRHGPKRGLRVLGSEEDQARSLAASLSQEQKRKAIISAAAPRDIITGRDRTARLSRFEGISFSDLDAPQQASLVSLLLTYVNNVDSAFAESRLSEIRQAGLETIHFAWAGTLVPGGPHYYRIHGPTFVVEYDNTQNNANHVHSVWRDFKGDFGEDLLARHYQAQPHRQ